MDELSGSSQTASSTADQRPQTLHCAQHNVRTMRVGKTFRSGRARVYWVWERDVEEPRQTRSSIHPVPELDPPAANLGRQMLTPDVTPMLEAAARGCSSSRKPTMSAMRIRAATDVGCQQANGWEATTRCRRGAWVSVWSLGGVWLTTRSRSDAKAIDRARWAGMLVF